MKPSIGAQTRTLGMKQRLGARSLGMVLCVGLLLLGLSVTVQAGKPKGKPKPPPPPPPPPPVQYRLTYLDNIWGNDWKMGARAINDSGVVVGTALLPGGGIPWRAFIAEPDGLGGLVTSDLNDLGAVWHDLDTGGTTTEWHAYNTFDLNELNQVAGAAQHVTTGEWRAFVFERDSNDVPQFLLLPQVGSRSLGYKINNLGVVAASSDSGTIVYTPWSGYSPTVIGSGVPRAINDMGIVVAYRAAVITPTQYHLDGTYEYTAGVYQEFSDRTLYDVNSLGVACGERDEITQGQGKRKKIIQERGSFRVDLVTGNEILVAPIGHADAINEQGDLLVSADGDFLYTDADGLLDLNELIVNKDSAWLNEIYRNLTDLTNTNAVTDPQSSGYGMICGYYGNEGSAFVLTPEPYVAP